MKLAVGLLLLQVQNDSYINTAVPSNSKTMTISAIDYKLNPKLRMCVNGCVHWCTGFRIVLLADLY